MSEEAGPRAGASGDEPDLGSFGVNAALVEEIRQRYEQDPASVDAGWARLFGGEGPAPATPVDLAIVSAEQADRHARVLRLIHSHRARGHRVAHTDPLGARNDYFPELDPAHYGLGEDDLDRPYLAGDLPGGPVQTLREILGRLQRTYGRTIGVEFTHVQDPGRKAWLQKRMEENENTPRFAPAERLRILEKLSAAELFERFVHTKFIGQKRFSLEGAESLIPALDRIVETAPELGIAEIVIGMAHRGRLNVLSNIVGKSLSAIFSEFEDNLLSDSPYGSGDVKYHKGYTSDRQSSRGGDVHISLTANPSHLEAVDPVVEGRVRAKQALRGDAEGRLVLPVLIHGDAAFAGQGIVAETLNLSKLKGYSTGGTLHVVVNNQIGFTTTPAEARSTLYCTDVAKMIQVPVFHVNGDDPEAVLHCVDLALAWRQRFHEDVVIDLVCYRRHGHNEGDEPAFTQPVLYRRIREKESVRRLYQARLLESGLLRAEDGARIEADLNGQLGRALQAIQTREVAEDSEAEPHGPWTGFLRNAPAVQTGVERARLEAIAERIGTPPRDFQLHPKLADLLERRRKCVGEGSAIDWATAEALAFGSLLLEGYGVRLSGQDSCRGTFSQRHAALVDQQTEAEYFPLAHLADGAARFECVDSLLSEAAVLGFEYGYSLADPRTLVLWEAQFGDFANGAQVIIDQFIASADSKWQRMSGLVLLLPHGYEGQGPEHSSARIERFLQLCADGNLQVANCTTPAQYFHLLRRQMQRNQRTPLVVFTPKSLLRHPRAISHVDDFTQGAFRPVYPGPAAPAAQRLVLCSGKLYYDLVESHGRPVEGAPEVALLRLEELHPWPEAELTAQLAAHPRAQRVCWAQEEPANMGAWSYLRERLAALLAPGQTLEYAGRRSSASPATGSQRIHRAEQQALVAAALGRSGA